MSIPRILETLAAAPNGLTAKEIAARSGISQSASYGRHQIERRRDPTYSPGVRYIWRIRNED